MKTYLVPTDFSEVSQNALKYLLASLQDDAPAKIILLHAYDGTFSSDELLVFEPMKGAEELVYDELKRFADSVANPEVPFELVASVGFPANEILREAKRRSADGIYMGTRSKHQVKDKVFGTVSSHVSLHAECPVMLIPYGADYRHYQNILVATESDIPVNSFLVLARLAEQHDSNLHFLHINTDGMDDFSEAEVKLYHRINHLLSTQQPYEIRIMKAESVWEGIIEYQTTYPMDLTVILPEHHSFWERLIGLSHTRQVVLHSSSPVLVLPGK